MLSETSLWPPGMRQIKAKPITTLTLSFFLPGAAPHPGPARRPPPVSLLGTPHLAEVVFTGRGLREMRLGHHKARWGRTSKEVRAFRLAVQTQGHWGEFGLSGSPGGSGFGVARGQRQRRSPMSFYKKRSSVCVSESDLLKSSKKPCFEVAVAQENEIYRASGGTAERYLS